jgi:rhodanese-related sulfurtransferase
MFLDILAREKNIHFEQVWDIGPQELNQVLDQMTIIDVRMREEISAGNLAALPGALQIPLIELVDEVQKLPREKPIVVICRNGWRSAKAAAFLTQSGFSEVYNLKGGLLYWYEVFPQRENN